LHGSFRSGHPACAFRPTHLLVKTDTATSRRLASRGKGSSLTRTSVGDTCPDDSAPFANRSSRHRTLRHGNCVNAAPHARHCLARAPDSSPCPCSFSLLSPSHAPLAVLAAHAPPTRASASIYVRRRGGDVLRFSFRSTGRLFWHLRASPPPVVSARLLAAAFAFRSRSITRRRGAVSFVPLSLMRSMTTRLTSCPNAGCRLLPRSRLQSLAVAADARAPALSGGAFPDRPERGGPSVVRRTGTSLISPSSWTAAARGTSTLMLATS
jgi:hypothetical protein